MNKHILLYQYISKDVRLLSVFQIKFLDVSGVLVMYLSIKWPDAWSRGYKTFFMFSSDEREILNAHKNIKKFSIVLGSFMPRMLFFPHIYVKMPTIVGI